LKTARKESQRATPAVSQAVPLIVVQPEIPAHLKGKAMQATFMALFTVRIDGSAEVRMLQSSGNETLDDLAMAAARQWRFKPATEDGQYVESYLRLQIEFNVK
jgi:TonB family protein